MSLKKQMPNLCPQIFNLQIVVSNKIIVLANSLSFLQNKSKTEEYIKSENILIIILLTNNKISEQYYSDKDQVKHELSFLSFSKITYINNLKTQIKHYSYLPSTHLTT
jgi:hypothetical protein